MCGWSYCSGKTCRCVHTPFDWDSRSKHNKHTVVLNVWSNHVFTYSREVHGRTFQEHTVNSLPEVSLVPLRDPQDRHPFGDMLPLDWALLLEQYQEGVRGAIFWTTNEMTEDFFRPM